MPIINVKKPFKFSEDGLHVKLIKEGEQEVSDRCALVAVEQLEVAELVGEKELKQEKKDKPTKNATK